MIASRPITVINGSNINAGSSGTAEGDVSTVKLEPLAVKFETVVNNVEPKLVTD
jgi:hypothetical protein